MKRKQEEEMGVWLRPRLHLGCSLAAFLMGNRPPPCIRDAKNFALRSIPNRSYGYALGRVAAVSAATSAAFMATP